MPLRDQIRDAARDYVRPLDKAKPLTKDDYRGHAETLLKQLGLGEQYLGFTLVCIANEFWRDQVAAIPFHRRLLLLPHCLKNAEGCPADYDEFGLDCKKCGACSVADFKGKAEELGYKVLVAEGTPIVLKIIVSGHVDAIVGVACLNVLEKAIDKILLAGIPCVAMPLLSSNCKSTSVDDDWVFQMIDLKTEPAPQQTKSYVHLMRAANGMFEAAGTDRLAPRSRTPGQRRRPADATRGHRLRLPRQGRQALAAVHHAGRLRRPDRRQGDALGRRARTCPTRSGGRPWPSRRSTRRRWSTTTSRTTTPSATAHRRCTASTASGPRSTSATT